MARDDPATATATAAAATGRLDAVVKAYDVRGTVPDPLGPDLVGALAQAFGEQMAAEGAVAVAVGHDMRTHSPALVDAVVVGLRAAGVDAVLVGLASTDQLYFASGHLDLPGVMVTASHNPAAYNGLKLCRPGARPFGRETGLRGVRDRAAALLGGAPAAVSAAVSAAVPASGAGATADRRAAVTRIDVLAAYADRLRRLAPQPPRGRRLRVVVDAANAMAGHTVPAVLGPLALDLVALHFELDGTFPHHEPNPLDPRTLVDLQQRVLEVSADIGLAFDGDADRCFVVDERGDLVDASVVTALIAVRALGREPGATVVHNLICSRAVAEIVTEHGGRPVRTPVGHSLVKAEMARTGAVFGGEHSGHYYFREFWYADSGLLAALHLLAALAGDRVDGGRPLSQLVAPYARYVRSGELNRPVGDADATLRRIGSRCRSRTDVVVDQLDGLTVTHRRWWFNLRGSNTEPLLRLNVEADDAATMRAVRDDVLAATEQGPPPSTGGP